MPKGAIVLKDLLSHKEKLKKVASSVKLSEECFAIIQKSLPQKEGDPGSFTLPCLIRPLTVKNALADLGASINLMPHSLFQRLGISKLKPTKMSIQLADGLSNTLSGSARIYCPIQVVPKKGGITVVKNEKDEFIPQWTVSGWRIRDKKGTENLAADHLSRLKHPNIGKLTRAEIRDLFSEERLMAISYKNNEPCVLTESYEDAWPKMKQHKFFDNVTAGHPEDIIASPPPQGKCLRPGFTGHISFVMHVNWSKSAMHVSGPKTFPQEIKHLKITSKSVKYSMYEG
ncbi:reverse transcriptase domain-containing protein [Tanacetum coccineum]